MINHLAVSYMVRDISTVLLETLFETWSGFLLQLIEMLNVNAVTDDVMEAVCCLYY